MGVSGAYLVLGVAVLAVLLPAAFGYGGSVYMSVDLGADTMKVALRAKPVEIVLNEQSSRKTNSAVGFTTDGERAIGSHAINLRRKQPARVVPSPQDLLGMNYGSPFVQDIQHHLLYPTEELDGRYGIPIDDEVYYPEEFAAILLQYAAKYASEASSSSNRGSVKDVVLVVPQYLTQHERQAYIDAAKIADLNVIALVNEGMANAWGYGRSLDMIGRNVIFFDIGAAHTSATLISYLGEADSNTNKTNLMIQTTAVAWDRSVGGRDFDERFAELILRDAIAKSSSVTEALQGSERTRKRLLARVREEARKAKEILSANTETQVNIESLTSDFDYRGHFTRAQFEAVCSDLFERALDTIASVISTSNITDIYAIELLGGAVRVPKVQEQLQERFQRETLDRHLNGDENAITGAIYYGALLSVTTSTGGKTLNAVDTIPYNVDMMFHVDSGDQWRRAYVQNSPITNKRKTFSLYQSNDFSFDLYYNVSTELLPEGSNLVIGRYEITGLSSLDAGEEVASSGENGEDGEEENKRKVKFYLSIDKKTGMLKVADAHVTIDVVEFEKVLKKPEENVVVADSDSEDTAENTDGAESEQTAESEQKEESEEKESSGEEASQENPEEDESLYELVPVTRTKTIPLTITPVDFGYSMSSRNITSAKSRLRRIQRAEEDRLKKAKARNDLESFIYATKDRVWNEGFKEASSQEERDAITSRFNDAADWLYGDGENAETRDYLDKFDELKNMVEPIEFRIREAIDRPEAARLFKEYLTKIVEIFPEVYQNRSITEEELQEMQERFVEETSWLEKVEGEQAALGILDAPAFTSEQVVDRLQTLGRLVERYRKRPIRKVEKETAIEEAEETEQTEESNKSEEKEELDEDFVFEFEFDSDDSQTPPAEEEEAEEKLVDDINDIL